MSTKWNLLSDHLASHWQQCTRHETLHCCSQLHADSCVNILRLNKLYLQLFIRLNQNIYPLKAVYSQTTRYFWHVLPTYSAQQWHEHFQLNINQTHNWWIKIRSLVSHMTGSCSQWWQTEPCISQGGVPGNNVRVSHCLTEPETRRRDANAATQSGAKGFQEKLGYIKITGGNNCVLAKMCPLLSDNSSPEIQTTQTKGKLCHLYKRQNSK